MESLTIPAVAALGIGAVGLVVCALWMAQLLPASARTWWREITRSWARRRGPLEPGARRVVTGRPASERLEMFERPARQPALRPDVLRRERSRLSAAESRRFIEQMADDEPERLAGVVGELLAQDDDGAGRRRGQR
ncbi:MAG: hypothetical protein AAGG08_08970 [Actinomycetota bacterium]